MDRGLRWILLLAGIALAVGGCSTPPAEEAPSSAAAPLPPADPANDTFEARQERLAAYRAEFLNDTRKLYRAATRVDPSDGVQEREAWILARSYLEAWVDSSATIIEIKQSPLEWIAENMSPATNGPGPTIRVNKENGSIRRQGSLQLVWPESFRDLL